jgi:hypothetical protein
MFTNKRGKHLKFYFDCLNNDGIMPRHNGVYQGGLCLMVESNEIDKEIFNLFSEDQHVFSYWADESDYCWENRYAFSDLRQTIVLFMAAINDEL